MIDTILFDLDGLMFDTERLSMQAWREVGAQHNVKITDEFLYMITGGGPQQFQYALSLYPDIEPITPQVRERRRELCFSSAHDGILNKPGLCELLDYLDANHYKKAVASSSDRAYVDTMIASIGKNYHFDAVIGGDEVKHAKMGTLAAQRANMHRIFIPDLVPIDDELRAAMEHTYPSLHEVIAFLQKR